MSFTLFVIGLLAALVPAALYVCTGLIALLWRQYSSPLQHLRGPHSSSFLFRNLREMYDQENSGLLYDWDATYGSTYAYKGFLGGSQLLTTDLAAVAHILSHFDTYQKPDFVRDNLAAMGAGRILNPAFTASNNKRLIPVFRDKAIELRDIWILLSKDHSRPINVLMWLSKATLDVIGIAAKKLQLRTILETWIPLLRKFRPHSEAMEKAHHHLIRIGLQLIDERKATINEVDARRCWDDKQDHSELFPIEPDLLSVLAQSNMASFAPQRMTTSEVLSRISTFPIARYETSSSALTWCLYALASAPQSQDSLREALRTIALDSPTLDEDVCKLEYLDWVRPFLDKYGELNRTIKIAKHDIIKIPIQAINKCHSIWGQDAHIFRPERWKNPPESSKAIQGLYSNILTFLSGKRGCIV